MGIEYQEGARGKAAEQLARVRYIDNAAPKALYHTRLDRFFVCSPLHGKMIAALDALWPPPRPLRAHWEMWQASGQRPCQASAQLL